LSDRQVHDYQVGEVVHGQVEEIFHFGVFVRLPDGTPAYIRRRELTLEGTLDPRQVVLEGQEIEAMVILLPERGRKLELSVRQAKPDPWDTLVRQYQVRDTVTGTVKWLSDKSAFVEVIPGVDGVVPLRELAPWPVKQPDELLWIGDQVDAIIVHLDRENKRLRLSIRQQIMHVTRVQEITGHLQGADTSSEPPVVEEPEEVEDPTGVPTDLRELGRVLILDDHAGVRDELAVWFGRHGCEANAFAGPDEALLQARQILYSAALVDLELGGRDGLEFVQAVKEVSPSTKIIVMSIPEWIAERSEELEALAVTEVFTKPLDLDDVRETLTRLARGEAVGPFRIAPAPGAVETTEPFEQLAQMMRGSAPRGARLVEGIAELVQLTRAELGVLFRLDPRSQQVSIVAQVGTIQVDHTALYALSASPVKDLILEGGRVFEAGLSAHARRRFQKLLDVIEFEACIGVPVSAAGRVEHALFLFHRQPDAFSRYRVRDAQAMATLLGVALESEAFEMRIRTAGPFLLSGQLAAGFGHDVYNKMSALELQVRNLQSLCGSPSDLSPSRDSDMALNRKELVQGVDALLERTLDLKETADAFRQLMQAEDHVGLQVNRVAERAVGLLGTIARRERVRLETDLAPRLPPIMGSHVRLQQVFLNVMLNAIQQMGLKRQRWEDSPHDWARLVVKTGFEMGSKGVVWVRFEDAGPGIHGQLWDSIFDLGFSTRPEGTGLGLFFARSLVESMGGSIFVERSAIPMGTVFRIDLPVA
jgi:signal transduction histidine kinase/predicted RNA-binding protein with RPS1 domain/DNA-binding NarL/FixJ family response regulator